MSALSLKAVVDPKTPICGSTFLACAGSRFYSAKTAIEPRKEALVDLTKTLKTLARCLKT